MGVTEDKLKSLSEQNVLDTEEASIEVIEEILSLYVLCINDIQKELKAFITKYGKNGIVPYSETRRRLTDNERKIFNTELKAWYTDVRDNNMDKNYRENLQALGKKKYITRMEYLQAHIRNNIEKLFYKVENILTPFFKDCYTYNYYTQKYNVLKTLAVKAEYVVLEDKDIISAVNSKYANTSFKNSLAGNKSKLITEMETTIPQAMARGFNISRLENIINTKTMYSRNRNIALTRTESNYLTNKANLDFYKELKVDKYQYLATLDMRTSDMCRDMDGYIGLISQAEQGVNYPPIHVHCRSTAIPYIENISSFGERAARNEYTGKTVSVHRSMTQEQYIKKFVPEEYRERLLKFKNSYRPKIEQN